MWLPPCILCWLAQTKPTPESPTSSSGIHVVLLAQTSPTPESATISSGGIFRDTEGSPVHAHGAGVILPTSHPAGHGGLYYMVGTTQKLEPGWLSQGINMYSSHDLQHWRFENTIFRNTSITVPIPAGEPPSYRIERPKILYNAVTRKYVMYFHLDSVGFQMGMVGVCTSDTVAGNYAFVKGFQPDGQRSLDMTLFQDADSSAYLVRSVDNEYTGISKLSDDYLSTTGILSVGPRCEAQAIWRDGDDYFMIGSHLTGWAANPAILSHAAGPLQNGTTWTVLGNPFGDETSFESQPAFVLPYTHPSGRHLVIYGGDRWDDPDVGNASYVWLPLVRQAEGSGFSMPARLDGGNGSWRVAEY